MCEADGSNGLQTRAPPTGPLRVVASSTISTSTETTPICTNRNIAAEEAIRFRKAQEDKAKQEMEAYKQRIAAQDAQAGKPAFRNLVRLLVYLRPGLPINKEPPGERLLLVDCRSRGRGVRLLARDSTRLARCLRIAACQTRFICLRPSRLKCND